MIALEGELAGRIAERDVAGGDVAELGEDRGEALLGLLTADARMLGPVGTVGVEGASWLDRHDDVDDAQPRAGRLGELVRQLEGRLRLGRAVVADADRLQLAALLAVAARRDEDRARRAVQRARRDVAGQHAADSAAVRRADHDEVGVATHRDAMQRAAGRAVGDGDRVRRDAGVLELGAECLLGGLVHDRLEVRAGAAADVVVVGIGVDCDQLGVTGSREKLGEGKSVAPALTGVDADDDLAEHCWFLSEIDARIVAAAAARAIRAKPER